MPIVNFIDAHGNQFEADVEPGTNIMRAAVDNGIDGILGECGGACSCATCHCYLEPPWFERLGPASGIEEEMLEGAFEPRDNSRLGCQIIVDEELDGITVALPERQY